MSDDRIKEQLDILKSEEKAKSNKRKFVEKIETIIKAAEAPFIAPS